MLKRKVPETRQIPYERPVHIKDTADMVIKGWPNSIQATNALRAMDFNEACDVIEALMEAYPSCFIKTKRLHDLANTLSRRADQAERETK